MTTVMICTVIGSVVGHHLLKPMWLILILDALVMGLFTVIGTEKAFLYGMPLSSSIFIGTLTAIGGGIMSDILLGQRPDIMSRGPWSASIALVCASWFVLLSEQGFRGFAEGSTVLLAVGIKAMALWRGWEAPMPEHLVSTQWIRRTRS